MQTRHLYIPSRVRRLVSRKGNVTELGSVASGCFESDCFGTSNAEDCAVDSGGEECNPGAVRHDDDKSESCRERNFLEGLVGDELFGCMPEVVPPNETGKVDATNELNGGSFSGTQVVVVAAAAAAAVVVVVVVVIWVELTHVL